MWGGFASGKEGYDKGQAVNFRGANLTGAKLSGTTASKADFSDAILAGANMVGADLSGAKMEGADLSGVDVAGARLEGANLSAAILTGVAMTMLKDAGADVTTAITDENVGTSIAALEEPLPTLIENHRSWVESAGQNGKQLDLSNVDMRMIGSLKMEKLTAIRAVNTKFFGMNLYKIQVQSAILDKSDFRNCDLEESDMRGSSFAGANFSHAKMHNTDCSALMFGGGSGTKRFNPCNFKGAILRYTDLTAAKLKGANFQGADLSYADLTGADLREADFTGANLSRTKLDDAIIADTIFDKTEKPVFQIKDNQD
ncbi:MAG: pentapeptide repeat-containing protein [Alphaproteobacteria bacterium]|nr:pentapeptide repeat-containing protein [Alphaproteobacteria bacterium]